MTDGTFSEELDLLYPDEVQTMDDVEEMPEPEILPTSETVLNEGEPLPETEASPNAAPPAFDWDSLAVPQLNNYVPRETMPETNNEGSVFMAYLRNENTIGSFLSRGNSRDVANVDLEKFNFVEHLRPDQLDDMEHYALDTSQEEINETEARLSRERRDKAIMESRPWETLGVGLITSPLEPLNYLPGGSIYKQAKTVAGIAKAFAASSFAAVASTTAQEAILHNNQLTRTVQESVWNVATSGLLGGALGTASNLLGKHYRIDAAKEKVAYTQIMDVLIDPDAPQAQVGGSVGATRTQIMGEALANLPEPIKKTMILSPGARLASSDFKIANRFHNEFIEHSFITEANERGQTGGQAVETLIKKRVLEAAGNNVDYFNAYYEMLGIKSGPFKQVRGAIANIGEPEMSSKEFAQRVSRSLFTAVEDPNPYVQKGTKAIQKTFDDIHKTLVELNLLPEGEGTKTSIGYLTIIPNKQLILEQGGRNARGAGTYPQAVFDGIKRSQVAAKEYMQSDFYKEKQTEISRIEDEIRGHPEKLERGLIEDEARQVKKLEDSIEQIKAEIREKAPRLSLDEDGNLWPELDDPTNWGIAMQHVDKVLSMQGDDLLNPVLNRFRNPKPLKGRTLMIDQEALHPWHIQDPVRLATMYSRALAPVVELETKARQYGYNSFEELKTAYSNELKLEYDEKSVGKTGKEAAKLEKQLRSIQKDITASLDMIQGVYSLGGNTVTSTKWEKFLQGVKLYNAYRMLGGITLSSLPDIGVVALRNGVFNTMYHGLLPMLKTAKTVSKRDLRAINYGIQSELGMRIHQFMDQEPLSTNPGFLTKSWEVLGQSFGDLTLFNQWSSMAERLAGTVSIHKTLDTIHAIVNGKTVAKKDRTRLAQLGIKEEYFKYIAEQTSSPDNLSSNGTRVADWTNWQIRDKFEADALRDFQAATAKDIDQTILEPGAGDLPLAARNIYGSLLLQFKSFMFTFTNKVIYSGIQRRKDAETYTGIALMLALGSLSYVSTKYARGEEPELDLKTLAIESIDRSGVLGPLMEVFDIAQTMNALPKSVFGEGVTRYKSRGIMGALTGPTGGTISDVTAVLGKMLQASYGDDDLSTSDIKKMMRLFPLQNISYINWLNDTMVTKIGEKFNLVEDREGK